ncbi:MAG: hypothetical protein WA705_03660 [Candidatus Ozemobacteraceae bacterium]
MVFDRTFFYQVLAQLIGLICTPCIVAKFGFENFGQFSLMVSYATVVSVFLSFRTEVCFSLLAVKTIPRKFLAGRTFSLILASSTFFALILSIFPRLLSLVGIPYGLIPCFTLIAFSLALFSLFNYYAISSHRYLYSQAQLAKNAVFYFAATLPILGSALGLNASFLLSIFVASGMIAALMFSRAELPGFRDLGFQGNWRIVRLSVPYLASSSISMLRGSIVGGLIAVHFSPELTGVYYFMTQFLISPLQTYSTVVANRIRYNYVSGEGISMKLYVRNTGIVVGFYLFGVFLFGAILSNFMTIKISPWLFSLVGSTYIILMPLTVLFEMHNGGIQNFAFSFAHLALTFLIGLLAVKRGIDFFVLINALTFLGIYFFQVLYALTKFPVCWSSAK